MWIPNVNAFGGSHHGYFLPHKGQNNISYALFSFPSLARYEEYRAKITADSNSQAAFRYAEETRCIFSYKRSLMRPVFK